MSRTDVDLPDPLVPADVDLRGMEFMPLYGDRLLKSTTWISASPEAKVAALRLWWHGFAHEVPAASLPNDDTLLAEYAGYGVMVKAWKRIRDQALNGWQLCSDGRLYHPLVAELAKAAWARRVADRTKKRRMRAGKAGGQPLADGGMSPGTGPGQDQGQDGGIPGVSSVESERESKQGNSAPSLSIEAPAEALRAAGAQDAPENPEAERVAATLRGLGVRVPSLDADVLAWAHQGVSDYDLRAAVAIAKARKGDEAVIPAAYLRGILVDLGKPRAEVPTDWRRSEEGAKAMGARLGIEARAGESLTAYTQRLDRVLHAGAG